MATFEYKGVTLEERDCPHCQKRLEPWLGPPDTGWGVILVCNNNECSYYAGSKDDILNRREESNLGCRYAEDPDNKYVPFALVAWCG